ncbi:MAG: crotonase/enoyl-CoA hydratase family protein [bacterium]|nr:crotonase/enoyl-CoA hydratase family protein [bacterium]
MGYRCFDVSIEDGVAHIILSRPEKRNSMIPEFWDELPAIIRDIDDNARARAIVISSTGPHFSSGLDVSAFSGGGSSEKSSPEEQTRARRQRPARFYQTVQRMQDSFSCLENCRIPVLVAIQGGAIGGGVDLATACDMRYATEDAFLTIFEINIGMTADVGTFPRLVKLIPEGIVREMAYTGRRMPASEAQAVGLVNRVFPDSQTMLEEVMKIAQEIASKAPLAIYGCKRMINYARDHSTADGLDYIGIWNASMLMPDEMGEAMAANAQKRSGEFADLPKRQHHSGGDDIL